ncbi:hypothetical protein HanRHA438_Chr12g0556801 [Helianthus annuus]|nr:hypothetical protein HanRHA438_Chr12g0556801 [Helianthus annuus]
MKISSKSILTPGQTTLSTSLSRRLRTGASVNGGASPRVFTTTVKKRGTFQNPEPSSPKVTCIGQVRVRTKKNALLLMRCRSDAIKVEGISRSWEPNVEKTDEEDELFDNEDKIKEDLEENLQVGQKKVMILDHDHDQDQEIVNMQQDESTKDQEHDHVHQDEVGQDQELDNVQHNEVGPDQEHENLKEYQVGQCQEEESFNLLSLFGEIVNQDYKVQEHDVEEHNNGVLERESEVKEDRESEKVLPDCLIMMMYEPKLSMEVSKETWVCQKDFIQRQSSRRKPPHPPPPITSDGGLPTVLLQPGRSSCSLPVAASMAMVLEQKLANAVGYEPFVLTRCKSEPLKSAAAKLLPESCVLENRKLERLSRGTIGVGAAGLGF